MHTSYDKERGIAISNCEATLGGGHGEAELDEKLEDKAEVSVDLPIGHRADGVVEIGHEPDGDGEVEDIAENHADQYAGGEDHLHELHEAFDRRGG